MFYSPQPKILCSQLFCTLFFELCHLYFLELDINLVIHRSAFALIDLILI